MRGGPPVAVPQNGGTRPEADIPCSAMPARRMNRDEFFAKLSPLGEDALAKVVRAVFRVPGVTRSTGRLPRRARQAKHGG